MKQFLLTAALGVAVFAGAQAETLTSATFEGYDYGSQYNLWKSANVSLLETWFANNDWGELDPQPSVNVTNQTISLTTPAEMGYNQWQGQVKVISTVALSAGETYDFSCIVEGPADSKVTVKLAGGDNNEEGAELVYVSQADLTSTGKICVYNNGFTGIACSQLMLILDFGGYPDKSFTISDFVVIKSSDNTTDAPEAPVYPAPTTVPAPEHSDILALFSSTEGQSADFIYAYWGQSTDYNTESIDGKSTLYFKSFNYQGWTIEPAIDLSDYNYLHVDYWTPNGENLSFTPINTASTPAEFGWVADNVTLEQWNSYDVPLSYFTEKGVDLSAVNQFKVDAQPGTGVIGYIANIYFYKSDEGGEDTPSEPLEGNGKTYYGELSGDLENALVDGVATDVPYTLNYDATWNEDATVTINLTLDTTVPGLVNPELWTSNNENLGQFTGAYPSYSITTTQTFSAEEAPFAIRFVYAGYAQNIELGYVVGSESEKPETDEPGEEEPGDEEGAASGTITGTFTNATIDDVVGDYPYTVNWEGVTNEDMTVSLCLTIDPEVIGLVPQLFLNGEYKGNFTYSDTESKWSYTTEDTFEVGEKPGFALFMAYMGGSTNQQAINYVVENPESTAIEAIDTDLNGAAEYFNLQGVKVANPQNGIFIKVQNGRSTKVVK